MVETRRDLIATEIERLKGLGEELERDWHRIPYLGAFVLSAGPAYWIWGPTAAIYAILCAPCLVGTALYLVGVRRSENRQLLEELEGQLRQIDDRAEGAPA